MHTKLISFVTSLDGDDFVKFCEYKEATPLPWRRFKNPEIYYLQAEQKDMVCFCITQYDSYSIWCLTSPSFY